MHIAALTMVHNEPLWAPIWARHYAAQLGPEHCYMIDHGTTDRSLDALPAPIRIEPIERAPLDEAWRATFIASRAHTLLQTYDAVIHTDADELLIPDPAHWPSLRAWAGSKPPATVTAVGLDVQHIPNEEPRLDPDQPIADQRRWLRFSAAMCKPVFTQRPIQWSPGFHSASAPLVLAGLVLLHFRYADLDAGLHRLARTRAQSFADPHTGQHQRVSGPDFTAMIQAIAQLPRRNTPIDPARAPLRPWLTQLFQDRLHREHELYKLDLSRAGNELWSGRSLLEALSV